MPKVASVDWETGLPCGCSQRRRQLPSYGSVARSPFRHSRRGDNEVSSCAANCARATGAVKAEPHAIELVHLFRAPTWFRNGAEARFLAKASCPSELWEFRSRKGWQQRSRASQWTARLITQASSLEGLSVHQLPSGILPGQLQKWLEFALAPNHGTMVDGALRHSVLRSFWPGTLQACCG